MSALADNGGRTQTMALGVGSPALEAGDNSTCATLDQRGVSRPQGVLCDIGAYESQLYMRVNSLNDPGDGTCHISECTLREAVAAAEDGGTITFTTDLDGGVIILGSEIGITKTLTVDGSGMESNVQLSGDGSVRPIAVSGIVNVTIKHLDFVDGFADIGGGLDNDNSVVYLSNCKFDTNYADDGGAINNNNGTLHVTDCTFFNNSAVDYGGAINNHQGIVSIKSSTIYENRSDQFGGGIFNNEGTVWVANSTLYYNDALSYGGGILNFEGTLTVTNSTLSANYVPGTNTGGGLINSVNGTVDLLNSIISDSSSGGDCVNDGTFTTNSNNLIEDGSCGPAMRDDPNLGPLTNNGGPTLSMALLTGSQAIDAGYLGSCETKDQRGISRYHGSSCDVGAFESSQIFPSIPQMIQGMECVPTASARCVKPCRWLPVEIRSPSIQILQAAQ